MVSLQTPEEAFSRSPITLRLQIHINNFAVLIDGTPQIMLFAIDSDEDLVNVKGVTIASVLSFQPACINGTELNAPKADYFATDSDATVGEKIFNISMA